MTPEQQKLPDENRDIIVRIVAKWWGYKFLSEADPMRLLVALRNTRMSCDSTDRLEQRSVLDFKADELTAFLDDLFQCLDTKVVVFSQWLRMHDCSCGG